MRCLVVPWRTAASDARSLACPAGNSRCAIISVLISSPCSGSCRTVLCFIKEAQLAAYENSYINRLLTKLDKLGISLSS